MVQIHPTAVVDPDAELGVDVTVGPFAYIEAGARIGDGCQIGPRVTVHGRTTVGARCVIDTGTVLGGRAQDLKCTTDDSYLEIGPDNIIREQVTIHRSNHEGGVTRVGQHNLLMSFVHLGHDCQLGNYTMIANLATFGGHCQIDDRAVIGGMAAVHQKARIGTMAMVAGMSGISHDVPPFCLAEGIPAKIRGVNVVGMRRNGLSAETRAAIQRAVRLLFCSGKHRGKALAQLEAEPGQPPELQRLLEFVRAMREGRNGRQLER